MTDRLRIRADWGGANLTRAAGWLTQWLWDNTPDQRGGMILTGRGQGDNLAALGSDEADIAWATPAAFAALARAGRGPFEGRPIDDIVAIGVLPHRDAMIPVVRADLGISTISDLAASDHPLRVSLGVNDPDGFMGFGADIVLAASGIDLDEVRRRGGSVTRHEQPFDAIDDLREGRADLMVSEAIMTPAWQNLAREQDVRFLSLEASALHTLERNWGLPVREIAAGYFPGADYPVTALDYSDWICAARADLDNETATLLARAFVENRAGIERGYRHLPVDYSPLTFPVTLEDVATAPIPLHPAAQAVYREAGWAPSETLAGGDTPTSS